MKQIITLILIVVVGLSTFTNLSGQCANVAMYRQSQIDSFPILFPNCTHMQGTLVIEDTTTVGNTITNIDSLIYLNQLDGTFNMTNCKELLSLNGMNNMTSIGGIYFDSLSRIKSMQGFNSLTKIDGNIFIWHCDSLESFAGMENVTDTISGFVKLARNHRLSDMSALSNVTTVLGDWTVKENRMHNMNGWNNLSYIGGFLSLRDEPELQDISALHNLVAVSPNGDFGVDLSFNPRLKTLVGLEGLLNVGQKVAVYLNDSLTNCEGLCNLIHHGSAGSYQVGSNGMNTTGDGSAVRACAVWGTAYPGTLTAICYGILPVELAHFDGEEENGDILLAWDTHSEIDNAGFDVQRSLDGKNWVDIGWIDGHGTSRREWNYFFTDNHPASGVNYYRLQQEDFDGRTELSKVISVWVNQEKPSLTIAPNPAQGIVYFQTKHSESMEVFIYSTFGQLVWSGSEQSVDVSSFAKGIYYVSFQIEGQFIQEKLIVE